MQVVDNAGQQSPRSAPVPTVKKILRSNHKVQIEKRDSSDSESESSVHTYSRHSFKPWNPSLKMKFPCALEGHEHEVSQCLDFFRLSPDERWKNVGRIRVCYTCLRPRLVCKEKVCSCYEKVPEVLNALSVLHGQN